MLFNRCILIALNKTHSRNPFYYSFLTDLPWQTGPIDLQQWAVTWTQQRYGRSSVDAEEAQLWTGSGNSCNRKSQVLQVLQPSWRHVCIGSTRYNVTAVASGNTDAVAAFAAVVVIP